MTRQSLEQIDRQLASWLREESATRAPARLVEDVFARTSTTRQVRRWWPPAPPVDPHPAGARPRSLSWRRPLLLGSAATALVVAVLSLTLRPAPVGPGASGSSPRPSTTASPSLGPSSIASSGTSPTPRPTTLGSLSAARLFLGPDAGPIDVTQAFGSIWVANIHANDVRRYDPATMRELARIPVPGAAWFGEADGALWVTGQTATGLSRIDPATNTVVAHVGDVPPCGAPIVWSGTIWQAACDGGVVLRIDPTRSAIVDSIPLENHIFLVLADDRLITVGSAGLARLDPQTRGYAPIGNPAAAFPEFMASDGQSVWVKTSAGVLRIDPSDGRTVASIAAPEARAISFAGDHAWLSVRRKGVVAIDLATGREIRTIPVLPAPGVPLEAGGVLWVTDFDSSILWRVQL